MNSIWFLCDLFSISFFCRSLSRWALLYKQEHMWHSRMSNQRGSYISVWLSAHLVLVFVVGNSWHPVTWQSLQDKAVLSRTEMFYRVWIASKTNILNWPTKNLTEGQVSTFPGFAEDNTYRGGHKTVSISQFMHQYHFQMLLNYNIYNLLNTRWILIEKFQAYNQGLQGWDLANLTRTKLSYS